MKKAARAMMLAFMLCGALPASVSQTADAVDQAALGAVVHDLCPREVAMLGESNTHGDGHTEAFKVALVERLVNECGFDSVLFEASHYEFLNFTRRLRTGQAVSGDQLAAAVGGLWKFDREFQPLVPFLMAKAQAGRIMLGGIDDQLGGLGQDYANIEMVAELTGSLPERDRPGCVRALHRRIYSEYTEAAPYSETDHEEIGRCLSGIAAALPVKKGDEVSRNERQEMVSAFERWIARDFTPNASQFLARDRSMFENFEWLRRQAPRRRKVIVWSATVHIAKARDQPLVDPGGHNFGAYVHQEYGGMAFSLGLSALAGSYRQGRRDLHDLPAAPADSLEAEAFAKGGPDTVYVGSTRLEALGTRPGAALRHVYQSLRWADLVDGVVVFRLEYPPESSR